MHSTNTCANNINGALNKSNILRYTVKNQTVDKYMECMSLGSAFLAYVTSANGI